MVIIMIFGAGVILKIDKVDDIRHSFILKVKKLKIDKFIFGEDGGVEGEIVKEGDDEEVIIFFHKREHKFHFMINIR